MDAGGNFALQIAAKPLLIATWLLLTAYRNTNALFNGTTGDPLRRTV